MTSDYDDPHRREPELTYDRYEVGQGTPMAIGVLECHGPYSLMWTLDVGSKRELLFLAFMAEFMPRPAGEARND